MKRCLILDKYKLKPQWDNLYTTTRIAISQKIYNIVLSVGEDLEKLKSLYTASDYVKWHSYLIIFLSDKAIPLLCIYPRELRHMSTQGLDS